MPSSFAAVAQRIAVFVVLAAIVTGAARIRASFAERPVPSLSQALAAAPPAAEALAQERERLLFFERRLAGDPGDVDILNELSALYLERLRETGAFSDLALAQNASRRSLSVVPPVRNVAGLTARAMVEFASHEFAAARNDARLLTRLDGSATPYALLGDADAELGDYDGARAAYARLRRAVASSDENVATRRARFALLEGDNETAQEAFANALSIEVSRISPSRERVAWYCWQLGDTAFMTGDYNDARARYDDALTAYPGYFRSLASYGRLDAAIGDYHGAVANYERAIAALPDPTFVAELGDVYALVGDRPAAEREYALVEFIGHLSRINGVMYNRQLVMFEADHGRTPMRAFREARAEYAIRRDILGADAVAWTALKAGRIGDAQTAMRAALRLGTADPRLLYHAGMIERAAGDKTAARRYLSEALSLSPAFDPLQARIARSALEKISGNN